MNKLYKFILVFLISMVPLVELRGGIPFAVGLGLADVDNIPSLFIVILVCMIGNMIPVPIIYFFARKVLEWGKDKKIVGKFFSFCLEKGEKGGKKLMKKGEAGVFIGLVLFVGIPIPGTGAWTGTLAASILDLGFKKTVLAVILGVILAGSIMMVLSVFFKSAFLAVV